MIVSDCVKPSKYQNIFDFTIRLYYSCHTFGWCKHEVISHGGSPLAVGYISVQSFGLNFILSNLWIQLLNIVLHWPADAVCVFAIVALRAVVDVVKHNNTGDEVHCLAWWKEVQVGPAVPSSVTIAGMTRSRSNSIHSLKDQFTQQWKLCHCQPICMWKFELIWIVAKE